MPLGRALPRTKRSLFAERMCKNGDGGERRRPGPGVAAGRARARHTSPRSAGSLTMRKSSIQAISSGGDDLVDKKPAIETGARLPRFALEQHAVCFAARPATTRQQPRRTPGQGRSVPTGCPGAAGARSAPAPMSPTSRPTVAEPGRRPAQQAERDGRSGYSTNRSWNMIGRDRGWNRRPRGRSHIQVKTGHTGPPVGRRRGTVWRPCGQVGETHAAAPEGERRRIQRLSAGVREHRDGVPAVHHEHPRRTASATQRTSYGGKAGRRQPYGRRCAVNV